jgi:hypothetical protein
VQLALRVFKVFKEPLVLRVKLDLPAQPDLRGFRVFKE